MKKPPFINVNWVTDFYIPYKNYEYDGIYDLGPTHRNKIVAYTHYKKEFHKTASIISLILFLMLNATMAIVKLPVLFLPVALFGVLTNFFYVKSDLYRKKRDKFTNVFFSYYRHQFVDYCKINHYLISQPWLYHPDDYNYDTDKFIAFLKKYLISEHYYLTFNEVVDQMYFFCTDNMVRSYPAPYRPQFHIGI